MELQNKRVRYYVRGTGHNNLDKQFSELLLFAQRHMLPFSIEIIYYDKCESNHPRTELNKALEEAEQFDVLIIHNNSILHIDYTIAEVYADVFKDKQIEIVNITQEQMKLEASV